LTQHRGTRGNGARFVFAALALALLTACSSVPRQTALEPVYSGRLALSVQTTSPQSWSAGFELRGTAQRGELSLLSPIGSVLAHIEWDSQGARLQQGQRSELFPSLDALLEQASGTAWPATALFDWMQGRPTPVAGWELDWSQWATSGLLRAHRSQAPVTDLRLVLER